MIIMECEMCGRSGASVKAMVEGVEMRLCNECKRHGTVLATPKPVRMEEKRPERGGLTKEVRPDLPTILKKHRKKTGQTQEEFASLLNVKSSTYGHWESGSTQPGFAEAQKLERTLGMPVLVYRKVDDAPQGQNDERGLTIGDILKKR